MSLPEKNAILDIVVTPKSSKSTIFLDDNGLIRVKLNSPPIDGKANEECIKLFSKTLGLSKQAISIIKGERGRNKRIYVTGLSEEEVKNRLSQL